MMVVRRLVGVSTGLVVAAGLVVGGAVQVAQASPRAAEQSPVGGEHAHTHHLHNPNGCVDLDSVRFEPGAHGLHHGVSSSSDQADMWHGTCDGKRYPGGPDAPPHH